MAGRGEGGEGEEGRRKGKMRKGTCTQKPLTPPSASTPPPALLISRHTYISRVSDQNGVSLLYIMLEIHHSGREPLKFSTG